MPPAEAGLPLTSAQIQALSHWIEAGASWPADADHAADADRKAQQLHWAFQPVTRPDVPLVRDAAWPRGEIDRFILARLEAVGLRPSPEADRRTLIRRLSYDLTGLPPTPEEVVAFVEDPSPVAYEGLVDRLLASPQYGEQWGRHWLDVARYSDTKGYVYAREQRYFVHSSIYRDWVIQAFNEDLPYNRFLLLQLAADQAAPDDGSAQAAMGYLTLGRRFLGVTPDIIDDRIDVVTRGMLGLTVGCARCHDHKYDPIPTSDYYSLYGIFQNSVERLTPVPRRPGSAEPNADYESELQARKNRLTQALDENRRTANERLRRNIGKYLLAQLELEKYPDLLFSQLLSKDDLLPPVVHDWSTYLDRARSTKDPIFQHWFALTSLPEQNLRAASQESLARLASDGAQIPRRISEAFSTPVGSPREVAERYQKVFNTIDEQWASLCTAAQQAGKALPAALPDAEDELLRQVLYGKTSPCVIPDEPIVSTERYFDHSTTVAIWKLQNELDEWLLKSPESAPHAVILVDREKLLEPRIFRRGNPKTPGDFVPRQVLSLLAGERRRPFSSGSGRLELARAIIDPENPLTARVWVNRVWQHHFGNAIVNTPSDFGVRADAPSHLELLNWLASEFVARGWSTKKLHRAIVLSAAYRQQSNETPSKHEPSRAQEIDPTNRLLSRMNPRKLTFEQYRDTLAFAAGQLDLSIGGRPVDLFTSQSGQLRRSVYALIDRQYLPAVLRSFDFANPDMHAARRAETIVPQQALFALNHSFVAECARRIARQAEIAGESTEARIRSLYRMVLHREPCSSELASATGFVAPVVSDGVADQPALRPSLAWSYGVGELDQRSGQLISFESLPYSTGTARQGGTLWPDAKFGWAQLTAEGGHPGNDLAHAVVRRWTSPIGGRVTITSEFVHQPEAGDGVRYWIVSSRLGILNSGSAHATKRRVDLAEVDVLPGDTIDFVVDIGRVLNNDQFLWSPELRLADTAGQVVEGSVVRWNAFSDFSSGGLQATNPLTPLEQLAHALLLSNEVMFID